MNIDNPYNRPSNDLSLSLFLFCLQSDPLGLNAAPAEGGDSNLGNGQRKRRSSEEQGAGPNSFKRAKVKTTFLQLNHNAHLFMSSVYDLRVVIKLMNDVQWIMGN